MTAAESSGEYAGGQLFFDAYAMAKRSIDEVQWTQRSVYEASGAGGLPAMPTGVGELMAATNAHLLIDLIEGRPPRSIEECIDEMARALDDGAITELIIEKNEGMKGVEPARLREIFVFASNALRAMVSPEGNQDAEQQLHLYHKAQELQTLKNDGTTVETIFRDEASYAELVRHAFRPEEKMARLLEAAERVTPQSVTEFALSSGLKMAEMMAEAMGDVLSQQQILEIHAQASTPEFQQAMVEQTKIARAANAQTIQKILERFWGEGVLENLPEDIRIRMRALQYPSAVVRTIGEVTMIVATEEDQHTADILQKRLDFSQAYCRERGWDHADLTFDQVTEIRRQPDWENPK
ncbi:MAG TPA: hypothetical protein VF733_00150 [Candidatus Saccharimonadales bacterium]